MNRAVLGQLLWKEYRQLRTFWLAMVILGLLLQAIVVGATTGISADRTWMLFALALAVPVGYAMGAGATLFAAEHEAGTFAFLQILPVTGNRLLLAKTGFVVVSVVALQGILLLAATNIGGDAPTSPETSRQLWGLLGMASVEGLAWGIFFSLLLREPMQAALLAMVCTTLGVHAATWLVDTRLNYVFDLGLYVTALPYRALVVAVVVAADLWLARSWLADRAPQLRLAPLWPRAMWKSRARAIDEPRHTWLQPLASLTWQSWREAAGPIGLLVILGVLITWFAHTDLPGLLPQRYPGTTMLDDQARVLPLVTALCGLFTFRADQRCHGRLFLGQRGVSSNLVWLSRQIVWGGILLTWTCAVLSVPMAFALVQWLRDDGSVPPRTFGECLVQFDGTLPLLACMPLAYVVGQIGSLWISSGVLCGVIGLLLVALACGWALLMHTLEVSWLWSVLPIGMATLAATRVHSNNRLVERRGFRSWVGPLAVLILPIVAILVAEPMVRVTQIPADVELPTWSHLKQNDTPEAAATLDLYLQGSADYEAALRKRPDEYGAEEGRLDPPPPLTAMQARPLAAMQESLALALEASRRDACFVAFDAERSITAISSLGGALAEMGRLVELQGDLDKACEYYFAALHVARHLLMNGINADFLQQVGSLRLANWSGHAQQTSARILAALAALQEFQKSLPAGDGEIRARASRAKQIIANLPAPFAEQIFGARSSSAAELAFSALPWERARATRFANWLTAQDAHFETIFHAALNDGSSVAQLFPSHQYSRHWLEQNPHDPGVRWARTTPLFRDCVEVVVPGNPRHRQGLVVSRDFEANCWDAAKTENQLRVTQLTLALQAWKRDHGALPEQLDELVGQYLPRVPVDPFIGAEYKYYPHGLPVGLSVHYLDDQRLQANKPFVWSAVGPYSNRIDVGAYREVAGPGNPESESVLHYQHLDSLIPVDDAFPYEVLRAGWPYPIR